MRKACDHFQDSSRGFQSLMVLPIASRNACQSAAPQGLILDALHKSKNQKSPDEEDQDIIRERTGRPFTCIDDLDGQLCPISISHDGDFATAVAIVPHMRQVEDAETKWSTRINPPGKQPPVQELGDRDNVIGNDISPQQPSLVDVSC
jgi:hypothetical protein